MDTQPDLEDRADAETSLATSENQTGSQVIYLYGGGLDREAQETEIMLSTVAFRIRATAIGLECVRRGGNGNLLSRVGVTVFSLDAATGGALFSLAGGR